MAYASCFLLWILSMSAGTDARAPQGAWRQLGVKWHKPPAELQLKDRYTEAALLYFGPNHEFSFVYATVIQGPKTEGVSHGDGQVVYAGTWKSDGANLSVEYRLVSRTVRKLGEELPGPLERAEIGVQNDLLVFHKMKFSRDPQLDNDLLGIYQSEPSRGRN